MYIYIYIFIEYGLVFLRSVMRFEIDFDCNEGSYLLEWMFKDADYFIFLCVQPLTGICETLLHCVSG